jgi:GH15 family glucan-1,4-alpha-glucosidase
MRLEDLGLIGNCQYSALVDRTGSVVWCCLPRFDSEPLFAAILDEEDGGRFVVGSADGTHGEQAYIDNTNVLVTTFNTESGTFRVLDYAPRFAQGETMFHPKQLHRVIEPVSGHPVVRVRLDARLGWSKERARQIQGTTHIRLEGYSSPVWFESNLNLDDVVTGQPFQLTERKHIALAWGTPIEEPVGELCDRYLLSTIRYWQRWVKHCNIPPLWQQEVIRSALALKLHCFEDTGAIVAAMTTSIPESPGAGRTWDYRYCWLRDSYYVLGALRLLGQFEEREHFLKYLLHVVGDAPDLNLAPLYRVDGTSDLEERILPSWPGFLGEGPVRVGNGAAQHIQNDIFGEMVLALSPLYLDDRFSSERSQSTLELIARLADRAASVVGTPDAGIWEYRVAWQPQTFSSLMCWAASDRMAMIAARHAPDLRGRFEETAASIRTRIIAEAWNEKLGAFAGTHGGTDLDAALLQMAPLRLLPMHDAKLVATIDAIGNSLSHDGWLFRYRLDDGFGSPQVSFMLCTFWMVEALAATGRSVEARRLMEQVRGCMSPLDLMAEDYAPATGKMWGNFPQAYSHAGLIHGAFACSPRWLEVA